MAFISVNPDALVKMHTYEGTASTNAQTGIDFQPDLVWLKISIVLVTGLAMTQSGDLPKH